MSNDLVVQLGAKEDQFASDINQAKKQRKLT
jgi:hypothetical protein